MINKLLTFINPYMLWIKVASYAIVLGVGLYGGYKLTSNHYQAKEAKVLQAQLKEVVLQEQINREVVQTYQANFNNLQEVYNKLKGKVHEKPLTNVPCNVTSDAARLWNDSLLAKESLPENSTRTAASGGAGASIGRLFDNA